MANCALYPNGAQVLRCSTMTTPSRPSRTLGTLYPHPGTAHTHTHTHTHAQHHTHTHSEQPTLSLLLHFLKQPPFHPSPTQPEQRFPFPFSLTVNRVTEHRVHVASSLSALPQHLDTAHPSSPTAPRSVLQSSVFVLPSLSVLPQQLDTDQRQPVNGAPGNDGGRRPVW